MTKTVVKPVAICVSLSYWQSYQAVKSCNDLCGDLLLNQCLICFQVYRAFVDKENL